MPLRSDRHARTSWTMCFVGLNHVSFDFRLGAISRLRRVRRGEVVALDRDASVSELGGSVGALDRRRDGSTSTVFPYDPSVLSVSVYTGNATSTVIVCLAFFDFMVCFYLDVLFEVRKTAAERAGEGRSMLL